MSTKKEIHLTQVNGRWTARFGENRTRIQLFRGSGEWSALYIDGKLDTIGDHYLSEQRLWELFGVEVEDSNDFMRGKITSNGAAQTVQDIEDYRDERDSSLRLAAEKRAEANRLLEEAAKLEKQHHS